MKCLIPGINVKIVGRAIHALAKIGDELYLESSADGLILRTINWSESAYCMMTFNKSFFTYYKYDYVVAEDNEGLTCKISMKSALNVFKSPTHMDKQVEVCEIKLDPESSKLIFQLRCKHGIVKTHHISILECRQMAATYSKDSTANRFCISHKTLSEIVSSFQLAEDQLTFDVTDELFRVRNYTDDASDVSKISRTQLSLKPSEFEDYKIDTKTTISFAMKEFRAVLMLAEALNLPIFCCFETMGKPAIFTIQNTTTFETDFVMATERCDNATQSSANTTQRNATRTAKRNCPSSINERLTKKPNIDKENDHSRCLDEDSDLFTFVEMPSDELLNNKGAPENDNVNEFPDSPVLNTQTSRIRNVFKRCFDTTMAPSSITMVSTVLASDSDED